VLVAHMTCRRPPMNLGLLDRVTPTPAPNSSPWRQASRLAGLGLKNTGWPRRAQRHALERVRTDSPKAEDADRAGRHAARYLIPDVGGADEDFAAWTGGVASGQRSPKGLPRSG